MLGGHYCARPKMSTQSEHELMNDRPPSSANAPPADQAASAMRHDVRNLLAPAMMALDRLSAHADPNVRAEAERGIAAIEAAVRRLKARV
jgi:hypothetical protein